MKRPNILLIQTDQMAGPALPMYGNHVVQTPHLEKLAAQGTTFKNAYCNNPICAPSRASMLTGQLTSRIGAYDNAADFPASVPTIAHYLRDLGYKTCLSGKMHFVGPDQLHGFEDRVTTDIYPSDFAWTPDWTRTDEPFSPSGISLQSVMEAGFCTRSMQIDYDEEVEYQATKKMYEYARAPERDSQPFFLTVSFTHPHNPYVAKKEHWDRYRADDINMPSVPSVPYEKCDPWSRRFYRLIGQNEQALTPERIRNARHGYYAAISYIDDKVGRLLNVLSECGFDNNTVVVFTSDHGDMMGERGMFYKFTPFEWSVRVPLIIRQPGARKGRFEENHVSLVDLLPTFLSLATDGNPPDLIEPVDGNDLSSLLYGGEISHENTVAIEYTAEGTYAPCLMIRKDGYKFIYCEHDPGMLFDLINDPGELDNLCKDQSHAQVEKDMLEMVLARWDPVQIKKDVIASQRRRRYVQKVLLTGKHAPWDYQPFYDASRAYVRPALDTNPTKTKAQFRFPYKAPAVPDTTNF